MNTYHGCMIYCTCLIYRRYILRKHDIVLYKNIIDNITTYYNILSHARFAPQESAALDSSHSKIVTGTTIVLSAPLARLRWLAGALSPMLRTSFARNVPSRSSCKHGCT